jgi:predicted deacylase
VLIDLHADSGQAIPYAIIDRPVALRGRTRTDMDAQLFTIAETTGLTVLRDYPSDQYQRFGLDRSLAGAMVNQARVPAVTIEAGPRRVADAAAIETAVESVKGILAHFGLVKHRRHADPSRVEGGPWRRSTHVRSREEGLFVPHLTAGQRFEAGDVIGEIRSVAGEILESVKATEAGIVVSWPDASWVPAGSSVGTLGVREVAE